MVSARKIKRRAQIPTIDDHNIVTPAIKLSQQIKEGHITSEEVLESFISRIKQVNPLINAVVDKRFEQALKEARAIDSKLAAARNGESKDKSILDLPLVGVPISVKESIGIEGYAFTGGLLGRRYVKAPKNHEVIDLLTKAGMIPMCLTNIPELAMWWDTNNKVHGRTNNPFDLSRIPGGSSGGEAALVSSAGSVVGVGNDIGGSIRMPCNFCGVFGHKPTPFVVPNEGMYPAVKGVREKLLSTGPICRYACDLLPMLKVMAGPKADKLKLDQPVDLNKLKVFYIEHLGDPLAKSCNADILNAMRNAVGHLTNKFKIEAEKVTLDELKYGFFLWGAEANAEPDIVSVASQYKGGRNEELNPLVELVKKCFNMSEHTTGAIMVSAFEKATPGHGSRESGILTKKAAELRRKFNDLLGDNGILLVPTHPEPAPKHFTTLLKFWNCAYTIVTTVIQAPITQCPLGLSKEGLPIGVQIMARPYNDKLTISVAEELESALGGWTAPCRIDV